MEFLIGFGPFCFGFSCYFMRFFLFLFRFMVSVHFIVQLRLDSSVRAKVAICTLTGQEKGQKKWGEGKSEMD
jgi:hypothetical protein